MDLPGHSYPPGYTPSTVEVQQAYYENLLENHLKEMHETFQRQFEQEKSAWAQQYEETRAEKQMLATELEQLRQKLGETQLELKQTGTPAPSTPRRSVRQTMRRTSLSEELSTTAPTIKTPTRKSTPKRKDVLVSANQELPTTKPVANKVPTPKKPAAHVHRLLKGEISPDTESLKKAIELHIRVIWGLVEASAIPPAPETKDLESFMAHFSNTTEAQLSGIMRDGPALIRPSLVQIGSQISVITTKKIAKDIKLVEEFILEYVQTCISKFGLVRWCPDLNQTPYSLYNSACRIIALNTFRQALVAHAYDHLRPSLQQAQDMMTLTKLYDHFVHYHMYEIFKRELRRPGSARKVSESNSIYQSRKRLADARRRFLKSNGYPPRYMALIDSKATSDDEIDPSGLTVDGQPVYWIKRRTERSEEMEKFIRLLDEKQDEAYRYGPSKRRYGRIRRVPTVPQPSEFTALPQGMPIDYFDPTFFNSRQRALRRDIASHQIALLPNVDMSFTMCEDERLADSAFQAKYEEHVLARYKLDDLEDDEEEDIFLDDDNDDYEEIAMEEDYSERRVAFVENMIDVD